MVILVGFIVTKRMRVGKVRVDCVWIGGNSPIQVCCRTPPQQTVSRGR